MFRIVLYTYQHISTYNNFCGIKLCVKSYSTYSIQKKLCSCWYIIARRYHNFKNDKGTLPTPISINIAQTCVGLEEQGTRLQYRN